MGFLDSLAVFGMSGKDIYHNFRGGTGDDAHGLYQTATVLAAVPPRLLEYTWGEDRLRWELEPSGSGTRMTLRHTLAKPDMAAMVAAGWHICFAVLEHLLDGDPVGVIRGQDAMDHGFERLRAGYAEKFADGSARRGD